MDDLNTDVSNPQKPGQDTPPKSHHEVLYRGKLGELTARGWGLAVVVALSVLLAVVLRFDTTLL